MLERGKCTQLEAVRWHLSDGEWWGLERLTTAVRNFVGATETAVSARVRELRGKHGLPIEDAPLHENSRQLKFRLRSGGEPETEVGQAAGTAPAPDSPQQSLFDDSGLGEGFASPRPRGRFLPGEDRWA